VRVPFAGIEAGVISVRVPSDSGRGSWLVRCLPGGVWTCTCPDHTCRHRECKHITRVRHRLAELHAADLRAG
jgi:hypothetical protein